MDLKIKCHILIKTSITIKRKLLVNYFDYLFIISFHFQAEMFKHLLLFFRFILKTDYLSWAFVTLSWHFIEQIINWLIVKLNNKNSCQLPIKLTCCCLLDYRPHICYCRCQLELDHKLNPIIFNSQTFPPHTGCQNWLRFWFSSPVIKDTDLFASQYTSLMQQVNKSDCQRNNRAGLKLQGLN